LIKPHSLTTKLIINCKKMKITIINLHRSISMEKAKDSDIFYTIDIGVNFAGKTYSEEKVSKIIAESSDCVEKIITISNCLKEVPTNKKLCLVNPILYYTAGVHLTSSL